jgi:hypothetical protein
VGHHERRHTEKAPLGLSRTGQDFQRETLGADLLLAATRAEKVEALLKEFFELCAGATLEKHVPVASGDLGLDLFGDDGYTVAVEQDALLAALRGLPNTRDLRIGGEDDLKRFTVSGAIRALLSRGEFDANFAL